MNIGTDNFVEVGGKKIYYHEAGEGRALVLIHGAGPGASGLSNWSRNIEFLSKTHRVLTIDLPGYGRSDKADIPNNFFAYFGEQLGLFLDALDIEQADLIGNSLGGGASMMLAVKRPEKVGSMVLMGSGGGFPVSSVMPTAGLKMIMTYYHPPGPTREKLEAFIREMVFDQSAITEELLDQRFAAATQPDVVANPPIKFKDGKPPIPGDVWRERLDLLQHRTLIVWGRDDKVMPIDNGFILLKQIPNAQMHVFPNCGHWAQWEKADEFNALVGEFLRRG